MNPPPILPVRTLIVGIDPGFKGAIGVVDNLGRFFDVWDMPTTAGEGRQREMDLPILAAIIATIRGGVRRVLLEWNQSRPDEAPESSKRMGVGLGLLEGMWFMAGCRPERVAASRWKGRLGLTGKDGEDGAAAAKETIVAYAETVIPGLPAGILRGPRGGPLDGRAEALLIAWWAATGTMEGLRAQDKDVLMARLLSGGRKNRRKRGGEGPVL